MNIPSISNQQDSYATSQILTKDAQVRRISSIDKLEQNSLTQQSEGCLSSIGTCLANLWNNLVSFIKRILCCESSPKGFHYEVSDTTEQNLKNGKRFDIFKDGQKTGNYILIGALDELTEGPYMHTNIQKDFPNQDFSRIFQEIMKQCNYDSVCVYVHYLNEYERYQNLGYTVSDFVLPEDTRIFSIDDKNPLHTQFYIRLLSDGLNELFFTATSDDENPADNFFVQEAIHIFSQCDVNFDSDKFISDIKNRNNQSWDQLTEENHAIKFRPSSYVKLQLTNKERKKEIERDGYFPIFFWMKYEREKS